MADGAEGALQAAGALLKEAETRYESQLELAKADVLRRWKLLPRNADKSPDAVRAALDRVGVSGELAADDGEKVEEFLLERNTLAAALEAARAAHDVAVATLQAQAHAEAQARIASVEAQARAAQEAHLAALRRVFPAYEQLAASDAPDDKLLKLAGLLEHVALRLDALDTRMLGAAGALTSRLCVLEARLAPVEAAEAKRALDERHPPARYVTLRGENPAVSQLVVTAVGGAANVALGKPVMASGTSYGSPLAVVDGNLSHRQCIQAWCVQDTGWLTVDLGELYNITCVTIIVAGGWTSKAQHDSQTLELSTEVGASPICTTKLSEARCENGGLASPIGSRASDVIVRYTPHTLCNLTAAEFYSLRLINKATA
jgi:hypothetical protein